MKKTLTIFACSFIGLVSFAQQDAQFSMNMFNRLSVNPAYAGTNQALCGTLLYRQQWSGFSGAPKTGLFSIDYGTIESLHGGVGLTIDQDQAGFDKTLKAKVAYSFHQRIGPSGLLGVGLDVGMIQKAFNGSFRTPGGGTVENPDGDPTVPWSGSSAITYDLGFGVYYTTRKLYIGLSSLHLPQQTLRQSGGAGSGSFDLNYTVARHYYLMAGYTFIGRVWDITPSILVKSDGVTQQYDVNVLAKYNKLVFAGVSYRLTDAAVGMLGLEWKNFKIGYAYDYTISGLKKHNNGTHEIMLGYCRKFVKPDYPQWHENVRFL